MKENFEVSDVVEQLTTVIDEADLDNLLGMYKLLCDPTAKLIKNNNNEYLVEVDNIKCDDEDYAL